MDTVDDMRAVAYKRIGDWTALPSGLKRDCRNDPEVMEIAINAGEAWCAEQVRNGVLSFSLTRYYVQTGMTWACADHVAAVAAQRQRGPDQVMPLLAACDQVYAGAQADGDHAATVAALKLKAQLQGALAPKQTETKVTISVADELAKRAKARNDRKQVEAKVIVDQSGPIPLAKALETLEKDVNSHE